MRSTSAITPRVMMATSKSRAFGSSGFRPTSKDGRWLYLWASWSSVTAFEPRTKIGQAVGSGRRTGLALLGRQNESLPEQEQVVLVQVKRVHHAEGPRQNAL